MRIESREPRSDASVGRDAFRDWRDPQRVEGGTAPAVAADKKVASTASANGVMVTLALSAADAEEVVYGAEYGTLWLSLEPADVVLTGTRVVTRENVDE